MKLTLCILPIGALLVGAACSGTSQYDGLFAQGGLDGSTSGPTSSGSHPSVGAGGSTGSSTGTSDQAGTSSGGGAASKNTGGTPSSGGNANGGSPPSTGNNSPGGSAGGASGGNNHGGSDASVPPPPADASPAMPPPPSTADFKLPCGQVDCTGPGQVCCAGFTLPRLPSQSCAAAGTCLPAVTAPMQCSRPSDCGDGYNCCAGVTQALDLASFVPIFTQSVCSPSACHKQGMETLCDPDVRDSCRASGGSCKPSNILDGYDLCR